MAKLDLVNFKEGSILNLDLEQPLGVSIPHRRISKIFVPFFRIPRTLFHQVRHESPVAGRWRKCWTEGRGNGLSFSPRVDSRSAERQEGKNIGRGRIGEQGTGEANVSIEKEQVVEG